MTDHPHGLRPCPLGPGGMPHFQPSVGTAPPLGEPPLGSRMIPTCGFQPSVGTAPLCGEPPLGRKIVSQHPWPTLLRHCTSSGVQAKSDTGSPVADSWRLAPSPPVRRLEHAVVGFPGEPAGWALRGGTHACACYNVGSGVRQMNSYTCAAAPSPRVWRRHVWQNGGGGSTRERSHGLQLRLHGRSST